MKRNAKPKVIVVIGTLAHVGGAERQAVYLVEYLKKETSCEVELLAFEDGQSIRSLVKQMDIPIHVHPYYFRWSKSKRASSLFKLASRFRFSIHADAILPFVGIHSKAIGQIAPYTGAKFYWWNQQDEGRDLFGTREEKKILERTPCISSNSTIGRDFLSQTYDLDPVRILVYNNGTPVPADYGKCDSFSSQLGLKNRPVITMLANITPFKDHATLLTAFQIVREKMASQPVLLLAGHMREVDHVHRLKNLAFDLGLSSESVRFLGPVSNVDHLLRSSDVLVHSSLLEGCPNAVCEAMAFGLPVVATDAPGCRQALGNDDDRWLVSPSNPQKLADALLEMLNSEELRSAAGKANRRRIQEQFSIDAMNRFFREQLELGLGCSLI